MSYKIHPAALALTHWMLRYPHTLDSIELSQYPGEAVQVAFVGGGGPERDRLEVEIETGGLCIYAGRIDGEPIVGRCHINEIDKLDQYVTVFGDR